MANLGNLFWLGLLAITSDYLGFWLREIFLIRGKPWKMVENGGKWWKMVESGGSGIEEEFS